MSEYSEFLEKEFTEHPQQGFGRILLLSDLSGASYYIANFAHHLASIFNPHVLNVLNVYSVSDLKLILDPYDDDRAKEKHHTLLLNQLENYLSELNDNLQLKKEQGRKSPRSYNTITENELPRDLNTNHHEESYLDRKPVNLEFKTSQGDLISLCNFHSNFHNLIIMGTQGMNFTLKRTFGSSARRIMSKIKGSLVLIVPIPEQTMDNGVVVWENVRNSCHWIKSMENARIRNIAYLVDGITSEENRILFNAIFKIAKAWQAQITFVHVDTEITKKRVSKFKSVSHTLDEHKEWTEDEIRIYLLKEEWKQFRQEHASSVGNYNNVKYVILEKMDKENVTDVLTEWLERNKPDLVGMMKRKHGIFKDVFRTSVSKRVAEKLTIPFLFYQEG